MDYGVLQTAAIAASSVHGGELRIFFDTEEIDDGSDWRARLAQGLRTSRLFLAFLSPNYIRSPNCRWEWEEYLRREHTQARGDDGIATVYFEIVPRLPGSEGEDLQQLEAELCADQTIAAWLDLITNEMSRRNMYVDPHDVSTTGKFNSRAAFDLRPGLPKARRSWRNSMPLSGWTSYGRIRTRILIKS